MSKINANHIPPLTPADHLHKDMATAIVHYQEAVSRRANMTAAERKTMSVLAQLGVTTPGRLAQETGLTTGAITGIVDRLEKAGYARREPNPDDRRSVIVRATNVEKMMAIIGPAFASLTIAMNEMRSRYSAEEMELICGYIAETTKVLRSESLKLSQLSEKTGL